MTFFNRRPQNTLKLLNHTLLPSVFPQFPQKLDLFCLGVHALPGVHLQLSPVYLPPPPLFLSLGVHMHPVHPLATPMQSRSICFTVNGASVVHNSISAD